MQRINLILIPGVLAVLVFLGTDIFEQRRELPGAVPPQPEIDYNGYSEGINSVQFDESGRVRYTLSARRQVSYLNSETALEDPFIQLYQENNSRWNITARSGRIISLRQTAESVEEIILYGDVEVYRMDDLGNPTVLVTDVLTIDPIGELLTTAAEVTMTGDSFEQSATGMRVNLNTEEYLFHGNVRGRYAVSND